MMRPLQVIRLTPNGRGAVTTICLRGSGAFELFAEAFRRTNGQLYRLEEVFPELRDRPLFGYFYLTSNIREEVVVHCCSPEWIEIHAHGGDTITAAILNWFEQRKAAIISWDQMNPSPKTIEEEILALLPFSKTEKTTRLLLEQRNISYSQARVALGFSTEPAWPNAEIGRVFFGQEDETVSWHTKLLEKLKARYEVGCHITIPWTILVLGAPNVGKSSLINALLGFSRSIVDAEAGTTRDIVRSETVLNGWPLCFYDTAGIRFTNNEIEEQGIKMIRHLLDRSDLILVLYDVTNESGDPVGDCFRQLADPVSTDLQYYRQTKKILPILNKTDLPKEQWSERCRNNEQNAMFRISVRTEQGLEELKEGLLQTLLPPHFEEDWRYCQEKGLPFPVPYNTNYNTHIQ